MLIALVVVASLAQETRELPGSRPDGSVLLPNGWSLAPHGKEIPLDSDLPVRMAWHPEGRLLAVQHAGYQAHGVALVDTKDGRVAGKLAVPKSWSGMAWSGDGRRFFVSGGVEDVVHVFEVDAAAATGRAKDSVSVGAPDVLDLPAGMCADRAGRLFVTLQRSHAVVRVSAEGKQDATFALPPESFPFECLLSPDEKSLFVSLWNRAEVAILDPEGGAVVATIQTGQHPSEMLLSPDGKRLFVSNGNENTVTVIDLAARTVDETLSSSLFPASPPGSTPNSLAISANGAVLLVANADNNNCAVLDVSRPRRARSLGFIPLGWYPTSIRFSPDGSTVWAANGKGGVGSKANPKGPQPPFPARNLAEYIGAMFIGSVSWFPFPSPRELADLSARAYRCAPLAAAASVRDPGARPADSPIPARPGDSSPITHCVYVIKENRTYDQVLGDDPRGNGDPSLCLFPEKVSPNHHAIAKEFVLLDNFYVESEVSADGHEWTLGAYATDFVERSWPVVYGQKGSVPVADSRPRQLGYPSEGKFKLATPRSGYLWDMAKEAGISYRSYGSFVDNAPTPDGPCTTKVASLEGHFDPWFRSYDLEYSDLDRAKRFLHELGEFEKKGDMPRLVILRLPNDHTAGARVGALTPSSYVAQNDLALGMVLEGLSKSVFWKSMAVFVVEDDAQNGPDHVDAHRTVALVAGPFVKRGAVVSTMYSTCSMLRTMELILGLQPMSQFDAAARPMYACFTGKAETRPYVCRASTYPLDEKNLRTSWGAALSETFDLAKEDAADDLLLNEVIWRSVKGATSPMPMPRRAAFVRVLDD